MQATKLPKYPSRAEWHLIYIYFELKTIKTFLNMEINYQYLSSATRPNFWPISPPPYSAKIWIRSNHSICFPKTLDRFNKTHKIPHSLHSTLTIILSIFLWSIIIQEVLEKSLFDLWKLGSIVVKVSFVEP